MDEKMMGGCTGNCHSCGSSCDTEKRGPSFFDRLETMSEHFEEIGEDNFIKMLNDLTTALEQEEQESNE